MRSIADTIARLSAAKTRRTVPADRAGSNRLSQLTSFGSNPGSLIARTFIPENLAEGAALVVVLHGCTQTADGYDHGSGWSKLAERAGFALLFAEQQRSNNANLCFNWFVPSDTRRDSGEAMSIAQMIDTLAASHAIDRKRIFITGLSAGGAMAATMLATYPDVFAGGAIIAGLPYGSAGTVPEAFDRMRGHGIAPAETLQSRLAAASSHSGTWPTLSIWQGTADTTVAPANADAIVGQWRKAHGLKAQPTRVETVDGHRRRVWCDRKGREVVESFTIDGMGHGTPLDPTGPDLIGAAGPYMLAAGISSTLHIARFWGIAQPVVLRAKAPSKATKRPALDGEILAPEKISARRPAKSAKPDPKPEPTAAGRVTKVIEDALRAAGLMR